MGGEVLEGGKKKCVWVESDDGERGTRCRFDDAREEVDLKL